jgi:hypothetical protein
MSDEGFFISMPHGIVSFGKRAPMGFTPDVKLRPRDADRDINEFRIGRIRVSGVGSMFSNNLSGGHYQRLFSGHCYG